MHQQPAFLSLAYFSFKALRCSRFLNEMERVIPWDSLIKLIEPYYQEAETGRKKKQLVLMLKIYFLQQWYNLSDPEMEDAIYDLISFQKFLALDMMQEAAPDETTILHFRHLLDDMLCRRRCSAGSTESRKKGVCYLRRAPSPILRLLRHPQARRIAIRSGVRR